MWGCTDFIAFAEDAFDRGDMLIINGSHLTLPGFGVVHENKKPRLPWILKGRGNALPESMDEQGSFRM